MKKPLLILGGLLGIVLVSLAAILLLVDPNRFRGQIANELRQQLHRPVTLGSMSLSLFPLAVRIDDVAIGERANFGSGGQNFATARRIQVRADLMPLLRGDISVRSLELMEPVVHLVKDARGEWNFSDLTTSTGGTTGRPFTLDLLSLQRGTVTLQDSASTPTTYGPLDVTLTDLAPSKRTGIRADLKMPGDAGGSLSFTGTGPTPLEGKLTATSASLSGLARFAGASTTVDGALSGETTIRPDGDRILIGGHLELANATAAKKPLGIPVSAYFEISDDPKTEQIQASKLNLTAGKVTVLGTGAYDGRAKTINAGMKLSNAALGDVLALARLFGGPEAEGTGTISLDLAVRGSAAAPDISADGSLRDATLKLAAVTKPLGIKTATVKADARKAAISGLDAQLAGTHLTGNLAVANFSAPALSFELDADRLDVAEWQKLSPDAPAGNNTASATAATQPTRISARGNIHIGTLLSQGLQLTNVRSQAIYLDRKLTLSPLTAELFGGTQTGSLVADLAPQVPNVALELKLANVETNQLLTATSSLKNLLYGALAASGGLKMQLGASDMPRTLNGGLNLNIANGRLAGTNILNELAQVGKFLGYTASPQAATTITQMGGDIEFRDGVANTKNLQLVMDAGSLAATGSVNLVDQTINLKADAVLGKAVAQKLGGGAVTAFLTNSRGELVLPVTISGTFAKPRFAPDAQRMLEMKTKNLIPGGLTPQGIIGTFGRGGQNPGKSILDALRGQQPPQATDQAPDTAAPAPSLLDLFRKKK